MAKSEERFMNVEGLQTLLKKLKTQFDVVNAGVGDINKELSKNIEDLGKSITDLNTSINGIKQDIEDIQKKFDDYVLKANYIPDQDIISAYNED